MTVDRAWQITIAAAGTAAGWFMVLGDHGLWVLVGALAVMAGPASIGMLFSDVVIERKRPSRGGGER